MKRLHGTGLMLLILLMMFAASQTSLAEQEEVKLIAAPLSKAAATIAPGGQLELSVLYTYPINATETYTWENSNNSVVSIARSEDGKRCAVQGLKDGKSFVSIVSASGKTLYKCLVTVKTVKVTSVSLNKTSLVLHPDTTFELKATVRPSGATYRAVTWKSSDENILRIEASDESSATIRAVGKGSASIIAKTLTRRAVCRVTVRDLSVSSIKFPSPKRTVYLNAPGPVVVYPIVSPATAPDTTVTLESSDESVAEIAPDGTLMLHNTGKTTITATSVANPSKFATCAVTVVSRPIKSLVLSGGPDGPLDPGETAILKASAVPADAENRNVRWESSNEAIVKVTDPATGAIEAVSAGVAVLTAISDANPDIKASRKVYVRGGSMKSIWIAAGGDAVVGGEANPRHKTSPSYDRLFDQMINDKTYDETANGTAMQHVKQFFEGGDVIGILNLEVTLTKLHSSKSASKTFAFRGKPEYARTILAVSGIDVVTLANNHTIDFGSAGYSDTKKALDAASVKYCGPGVKSPKNIVEKNGVKVGFLGYVSKGASASTVRAQVKGLKSKCDMVVVSFHWTDVAQFYYRKPNSKQRSLAHAAIDAGAKLVLGHHVHRINGVEKYKDGYIAYDLANFFTNAKATMNKTSADNPLAKEDFDSIIYRQKFNVFEDGYVEAVGLDGDPDKNGIQIIPICTTSSLEVNNTMPKPYAEAEDKRRVLNTLNRFSINFSYPIP